MIVNEKINYKLESALQDLSRYAHIDFEFYGSSQKTYIYDIIGIRTSQDYKRVQNIIKSIDQNQRYPGFRFGFSKGNFARSKSGYQLTVLEL